MTGHIKAKSNHNPIHGWSLHQINWITNMVTNYIMITFIRPLTQESQKGWSRNQIQCNGSREFLPKQY